MPNGLYSRVQGFPLVTFKNKWRPISCPLSDHWIYQSTIPSWQSQITPTSGNRAEKSATCDRYTTNTYIRAGWWQRWDQWKERLTTLLPSLTTADLFTKHSLSTARMEGAITFCTITAFMFPWKVSVCNVSLCLFSTQENCCFYRVVLLRGLKLFHNDYLSSIVKHSGSIWKALCI